MQTKNRQFLFKHKYIVSNRLPQSYSRTFLFNSFRDALLLSAPHTFFVALGLLRWRFNKTFVFENRVRYNSTCFLTSRSRGISKRFSISRVRLKHVGDAGKLFGLKKSSW